MPSNMKIICYPDEVKTTIQEWSKAVPDGEYFSQGQKVRRKNGRFEPITIMYINLYFIVPIFHSAKCEAVRSLFKQEVTKWNGNMFYEWNAPYQAATPEHEIFGAMNDEAAKSRQPCFCFDITRVGDRGR